MNISVFIFISIMALAFGYAVSNTQNFNFWKLLFFALFLLPIIVIFGMGKYHAIVVLISFMLGFVLPYAHSLKFIGNGLSGLINNIRYRDDYKNIKLEKERIKEQQEELEKLRKAFEEAKRAYQEAERKHNEETNRQEDNNGKSNSDNKSKQQSYQNKQKSSSHQKQSSGNDLKIYYLNLLGLNPVKKYTLKELKKSYKRIHMKYHPDRNQWKSAEELLELNRKMVEFQKAFEWLRDNG